MESIDKMRRYFSGRAKGLPYDIKAAVIAVTVDDVFAMLDEIEREVKELTDERDLLKTQWEAGVDFDQRLAAAAEGRADVTLFGVDYMAYPLDADGVPIHVGDVMAYADNTKPMEVVALVPPAVFLVEDGPRYADMCRHHHAPTVEGVLREMLDVWGELPSNVTNEAIIAEYAAKLRLANDND